MEIPPLSRSHKPLPTFTVTDIFVLEYSTGSKRLCIVILQPLLWQLTSAHALQVLGSLKRKSLPFHIFWFLSSHLLNYCLRPKCQLLHTKEESQCRTERQWGYLPCAPECQKMCNGPIIPWKQKQPFFKQPFLWSCKCNKIPTSSSWSLATQQHQGSQSSRPGHKHEHISLYLGCCQGWWAEKPLVTHLSEKVSVKMEEPPRLSKLRTTYSWVKEQ